MEIKMIRSLIMGICVFMISASSVMADMISADKFYENKSYSLASREYALLLNGELSKQEAREVRAKLADCILKGKDQAQTEDAIEALKVLIESENHDRWWAQANESLARYYFEVDRWSFHSEIKQYLEAARDYWAGSSDVELARRNFVDISFFLGDYVVNQWGWGNNQITPLRFNTKSISPDPQPNQGLIILYEEILKVAKSDDDKAKANYSLAMAYSQNYTVDANERKIQSLKYFQIVIDDYSSSEWADDAYYQLGMLYENQQDFVKALDVYRDFQKHYRKGESQWFDHIERLVQEIADPKVQISVSNTFVPGSEVQFSLNWRNTSQTVVTFYKVDLTEELELYMDKRGKQKGFNQYQELVKHLVEDSGKLNTFPVALSFKVELKDEDKHMMHGANKGLADWRRQEESDDLDTQAGVLEAGAFIVVATTAGGAQSYDLVLVSDLALVSKITDDAVLFFAMDAFTGKPVAQANVKFVYTYYDQSGHTIWDEGQGITDENGLLKVGLKNPDRDDHYQNHQLFAGAVAGDKQAFVKGNFGRYNGGNKGEWWLYAFSDRPAYRPNETVSFKGVLRQYDDGLFSNPSGKAVKARIYNAQGNQVKEATYTLNDYGAFDDTLLLDEKAVMGEYYLDLYTADFGTHLSRATIFRLEEYKLPEFLVNIKPQPKENDAQVNGYRLGDTVKVEVDAQYYFGGPVANAEVEYLVYQNSYQHTYQPVRQYNWYYEDMYPRRYNYGGYGTLLKTEKIKTDANGKAEFTIETPANAQNDFQYYIEVRVVDQSRREISSTADIKVTQNAFFAFLEPRQNLYRPGDKAKVSVKTMTANNEPVSVDGKVTVTLNSWREPIMKGKELVTPGNYNGQVQITKFIKTDAKGEAVFEFEPNADGYYTVQFTGFDMGNEVKASANVYVCDTSSKDIGYQYGGVQIILEKDTFAVGDTARAMIVSDQPDAWVLLTAEADDLYDYQMVHLEGNVKLIEIPITESFTPNVFLNLASGYRYQLRMENQQIIVPPDEKFLNVTIASDKEVYQPQEKGVFDITVTDQDGKPVRAEVALGITDASVYYIQDEFAQDIRQFYYGDKRRPLIQTQASFYQRAYVNLVRGKEDALITDGELNRLRNLGNVNELKEGVTKADGPILLGNTFREDDFGFADSVVYPQSIASDKFSRQNSPEVLLEKRTKNKLKSLQSSDESGQLAVAEVRNDFRSTVIWQPTIQTDAEGKATVTVTFPDSLTTWRATARGMTQGTFVGNITHEVKSKKDLMVRLQAPRFFTERDLVVISALIDNTSDEVLTVLPKIEIEGGLNVTGIYQEGEFKKGEMCWVDVPANGQKRVDWAVRADKAGTASIKVTAQSEKYADAMVKSYPVIPHGIEKFIADSLVIKERDGGKQTKELTFNVPKERINESTSLRINVSPSLAANLLDALPYLADYPYGCVEQTMSRFLPAVIVAKTMRDLGISERDIQAYISDVLAPSGDPVGHPNRQTDTTYSKLEDMTAESLKRLYDFQHGDGGWGWWKEGESDHYMSAYVVWGLSLARRAGIDVKADAISRGVNYLKLEIVEEENNPDMLAWMLHALAQAESSSEYEDKQRERLWKMRDQLKSYSRALFAISEHLRGSDRAPILAQNLINGIDEDEQNNTGHWGMSRGYYRWSDGAVEATAFTIQAMSLMDPDSIFLDPAVKWMNLNRRGSRWSNTKDTAIAILGLTDYLKASRELAPEYRFKVYLNGELVNQAQVNTSNIFTLPRFIDIAADKIVDGKNTVRVEFEGKGELYLSGYLKYFTLEEGITSAGNEVFVKRKYYKKSTKETLMKGYTEDWFELKDSDAVKSGDRIRVDIILESKNDYEYLILEDYKPAGLEAVELKSGSGQAIRLDRKGRETDKTTWLYQEWRDQKAVFFISKVDQGKHLIRYELRAEVPGEFHAMPNQTHAMYVPEIRANSDEMRLQVSD